MKGTQLGEFEELVLLTVGVLHDNAYAVSIYDELCETTGRKVILSSVHKSLMRLEDKGYLQSELGNATASRGGRAKRLYTLTKFGIRVLDETRTLRNSFWGRIPEEIIKGQLS